MDCCGECGRIAALFLKLVGSNSDPNGQQTVPTAPVKPFETKELKPIPDSNVTTTPNLELNQVAANNQAPQVPVLAANSLNTVPEASGRKAYDFIKTVAKKNWGRTRYLVVVVDPDNEQNQKVVQTDCTSENDATEAARHLARHLASKGIIGDEETSLSRFRDFFFGNSPPKHFWPPGPDEQYYGLLPPLYSNASLLDSFGRTRRRKDLERARGFDLVTIHGLGGHHTNTWELIDARDTAVGFWPYDYLVSYNKLKRSIYNNFEGIKQDFLPTATARVLTVGHPIRLLHSREGLPIERLAEQIVSCLLTAFVHERPIIWFAHSLGGILLKYILRACTGRKFENTNAKNILSNTKGVIFFGTPHHGTRLPEMAATLFGVGHHVQQILEPGDTLEDLNTWFLSQRIDYCNLIEMLPVPVLRLPVVHESEGRLAHQDVTRHVDDVLMQATNRALRPTIAFDATIQENHYDIAKFRFRQENQAANYKYELVRRCVAFWLRPDNIQVPPGVNVQPLSTPQMMASTANANAAVPRTLAENPAVPAQPQGAPELIAFTTNENAAPPNAQEIEQQLEETMLEGNFFQRIFRTSLLESILALHRVTGLLEENRNADGDNWLNSLPDLLFGEPDREEATVSERRVYVDNQPLTLRLEAMLNAANRVLATLREVNSVLDDNIAVETTLWRLLRNLPADYRAICISIARRVSSRIPRQRKLSRSQIDTLRIELKKVLITCLLEASYENAGDLSPKFDNILQIEANRLRAYLRFRPLLASVDAGF